MQTVRPSHISVITNPVMFTEILFTGSGEGIGTIPHGVVAPRVSNVVYCSNEISSISNGVEDNLRLAGIF